MYKRELVNNLGQNCPYQNTSSNRWNPKTLSHPKSHRTKPYCTYPLFTHMFHVKWCIDTWLESNATCPFDGWLLLEIDHQGPEAVERRFVHQVWRESHTSACHLGSVTEPRGLGTTAPDFDKGDTAEGGDRSPLLIKVFVMRLLKEQKFEEEYWNQLSKRLVNLHVLPNNEDKLIWSFCKKEAISLADLFYQVLKTVFALSAVLTSEIESAIRLLPLCSFAIKVREGVLQWRNESWVLLGVKVS
ncbi:hypothetical protein JCGZ_04568 [Jatropha curcas]|uniref:Uncharacterized protein n=1 Tax=Jatropha curcas TaxID=180498 RepID=A0A067LQ10_JATCU|nr:hypothetical protein JCGZ_04568 [Jatropha curcas]